MFLSNANKHIFSVLTILGVVPFIGCAALLLCNIYALPVIGNVAATINVYGLLIASFIAGSHWGKALVEDTVQPGVAVSSNIVVLILWISYCVLSIPLMLLLECSVLACLFLQEQRTWQASSVPAVYRKVRCGVSIVVIVLLLLMAIQLW